MVRTVIVIATLATSGFCAAAYVVGWLLILAAGARVQHRHQGVE